MTALTLVRSIWMLPAVTMNPRNNTLLHLDKQLVLQQSLKDTPHMLHMLLLGLGKDQIVFQIYQNKLVQHVPEHVIY